ncbi:hypothetical protein [Methanolobus psychrotolerans]|uniref:hypothetical protein n=1 Tax=Methanolobus psychrotolerans TaxID=1874706 RepID=UPI000B9159BC|nr:hypothetical protein [Methanolobus psychrotolerans]
MTRYDQMSNIIKFSLEELGEITQYLSERENAGNPTTVLIGGWAGDSYNSWYGSIDIDLITNISTRSSLSYFLREERNFIPYKLPGVSTGVQKNTEAGSIIIDFETRQKPFPFEGRVESLDFTILDGNTETRKRRGSIEIAVPNRATLLVLKLKAIWDRHYRIEKQTSDDIEWERGKLIKDHADLLALIDPNYGGYQIDIPVLGKLLELYPFLEESLISVYESEEGIEKYSRMSPKNAKTAIDTILSLIH